MVWHAAIWIIYKARNDCISKNIIKNKEELVEKIKVMSWQWSLGRMKIPASMLYEWLWNSSDCLLR